MSNKGRGGSTNISKAKVAAFTLNGPGGSPGSTMALSNSKPKGSGGKGFLINHNAFTDVSPPGIRGMRKSADYPNFKSRA